MAKNTIENLDQGQLELMWNFLKMGNGKPNISALKENLDALRQILIQKTAGQEPYKKPHEIPFEDYDTIINCIVIEAMQLYLSGALDKSKNAGPVKSGHWIFKKRTKLVSTGIARVAEDKTAVIMKKHTTIKVPYCSICGERGDNEGDATPFCPNCGARMDGSPTDG